MRAEVGSGAEAPAKGERAQLAACWLVVLASLVAVLVLGPVPERARVLVPALLVGGLAWWRASVLSERVGPGLPVLLASAFVLRLVALAASPGLSDDVHRYVWEAEAISGGWSPYTFAPAAPELDPLRRERPALFARLNHPETPAAYPPVYQAAASGVVALARVGGGDEAKFIARAVLALRAFAGLCDLLVLVPLVALLRALGRPRSLAVVWAWSPLAALEFGGAGHMDALGILAWTGALALLAPAAADAARRARGDRPSAGLALLAAAVLVKYLPIASLPFALRGPRRAALRDGALVLGLVALAFTPLLALHGGLSGLLGGLSDYGLRWESTSLVYRFVEAPFALLHERDGSPLDPRRVGRTLVAVAWLGAAAWLWLRGAGLLRASWSLLGLYLVLSPTLHPWYVAWTLPFLALFPSRAWSWLAAAVPLSYWMLARWWSEGVWVEPGWLWPTLALPFFALAVLDARRSAR